MSTSDKPAGTKFGVQAKMLLLLVCVSLFFIASTIAAFWGLMRIERSAAVITDQEAPFVRSTQEALFALAEEVSVVENLLDTDSPQATSTFRELESEFESASTKFQMFIAAITWGSETDAFRSANGGESYRLWVASGLKDTLLVPQSPPEQTQLAGQISLYYAAYLNNARRAIAARSEYLAFSAEKKVEEAGERKSASQAAQAQARRFAGLVIENLSDMIERSNQTTAANAKTLEKTEKDVRLFILISSLSGLVAALAFGLLFARKVIVQPITSLARAASAFGAGNFASRVDLQTRDEMGLLGAAFNEMADRLQSHTSDLEGAVSARTLELETNVKKLTEREADLQLANEKLRELDKAKSEFLSVAAHQLRTPLSAIKWILAILGDNAGLDPEQRGLVLKGTESNERMIKLINDMLAVTRIEAGKVRYTFAPLHIEDVIENVMLDFQSQAYARKIRIAFNKPTEQLPYISADPERLRDVLENLIENSIRYTKEGGSITLSAAKEGSDIKVAVADDGIGIPTKQQSSIFNKFFRADNAVKVQTDGSGLGLFIVRAIVEKHGGRIWFESEVGKGTSFFFTIPMSKENA